MYVIVTRGEVVQTPATGIEGMLAFIDQFTHIIIGLRINFQIGLSIINICTIFNFH